MAAPIERIVDAHIHLWDPASVEWYPYLAGQRGARHGRHLRDVPAVRPAHVLRRVVELACREVRARRRRDRAHSGDETAELEGWPTTTGHPDAIIGGMVPGDPIAEIERLLDSRWSRRGSAASGPWAAGSASPGRRPARARRARPVFELMVHPDLLESAAAELADFGELDRGRGARGLAAVGRARGARALDARASPRWRRSATTCTASCRDWRCRSTRRGVACCDLDRALPRRLRRRPVHVRQQLPGRRDARHVRRALRRLRRADRATSTTRPATSSSPRTPSASTAAEVASRGRAR